MGAFKTRDEILALVKDKLSEEDYNKLDTLLDTFSDNCKHTTKVLNDKELEFLKALLENELKKRDNNTDKDREERGIINRIKLFLFEANGWD